MPRLLVIADSSLGPAIEDCRELIRSFAGFLNDEVTLALVSTEAVAMAVASLAAVEGSDIESVAPRPAFPAAPMSAAPFVWKEDGRPNWEEMWSGFCELALYGGPPHRGEADALHAASGDTPSGEEWDPVREIRRGIWETAGLFSEPSGEPGWLAVTCRSTRMAAWLCASIILENVDARCDGDRLLVPASPSFRLKNEVKSVITVVAKTNHYWEAHVLSQAPA